MAPHVSCPVPVELPVLVHVHLLRGPPMNPSWPGLMPDLLLLLFDKSVHVHVLGFLHGLVLEPGLALAPLLPAPVRVEVPALLPAPLRVNVPGLAPEPDPVRAEVPALLSAPVHVSVPALLPALAHEQVAAHAMA